ncbi:MAG: DUF1641 domain-containing protein [Myxococcales bacterium]|nr:DUF1641 domain-containing protein [Myxococcales bacterium]
MEKPSSPGGASGQPLARIEARLERIEAMLSRFEEVAVQAPGLAAMGGDILDEWASQDGHMDERLKAAASLLERLTRPEILTALTTLVEQLEAAPGLIAMLGDIGDELALQAAAEGIDMHAATENLFMALRAFAKALAHPEMRELWESGAFSPEALRTMNLMAGALSEAREAGAVRIGFFGAMGQLRDPDVQRALGFAATMAKAFGHGVDAADATG